MDSFGQQLKHYRESLGLSEEELSAELIKTNSNYKSFDAHQIKRWEADQDIRFLNRFKISLIAITMERVAKQKRVPEVKGVYRSLRKSWLEALDTPPMLSDADLRKGQLYKEMRLLFIFPNEEKIPYRSWFGTRVLQGRITWEVLALEQGAWREPKAETLVRIVPYFEARAKRHMAKLLTKEEKDSFATESDLLLERLKEVTLALQKHDYSSAKSDEELEAAYGISPNTTKRSSHRRF